LQLLNDFQTTVRKALDEIDPKWESYPGVVICGTHKPFNVEMLIDTIRLCKESRTPYLGICFGHQLAAIEYARNDLGIDDATSEEFGKGTFVVKKRDSLKVGLHEGESWWNNYEVSIVWEKPDYFVTCQFHPEYQSNKEHPHPLLVKFLDICRNAIGQNHSVS
jgi:CTP synthase (UTP-ammonia lyase)